ncbi:MAG: hypothetical protein GX616_05530 [Planctomycetes bacterium]|nr:hypothetical protein [Planctomycetota bacterium]
MFAAVLSEGEPLDSSCDDGELCLAKCTTWTWSITIRAVGRSSMVAFW